MPIRDPDKRRLYQRSNYIKNQDKRKAYQKEKRSTPEGKLYQSAYNIEYSKNNKESMDKYYADRYSKKHIKIKIQRGAPMPDRDCPELCEICNMPETKIGKSGKPVRLALDHCHKTGKFRGWLCFACNTSIGKMRDDSSIARKMAEYIDACGPVEKQVCL